MTHKRYTVDLFPKYMSEPSPLWQTNHLWVARLWAWWAVNVMLEVREIRVEDRVTGEHYVR